MSLISREKLLAHFSWWPDTDENKGIFESIIARQPDVDAEHVVRCKDCKYCLQIFDEYWCNGFCSPMRLVRKGDFCSYGERRKDGADDE